MRVRSLAHGGVALAVLLAPVGLTNPSAAASSRADAPIPTEVDIHSLGSEPITFNTHITIRGQVLYTDPADGKRYAADGSVLLERRLAGASDWTSLGGDDFSVFYPVFLFSTVAQSNAAYRVTFAGDERYEPSMAVVSVRVARQVTAKMSEPRENVFFLSGRVSPAYAGRPVTLMRKKCSSCSWRGYTTKNTSSVSQYRFRLPLPTSGSHYFRVRVPADTSFVTTYSSSYQLMRLF